MNPGAEMTLLINGQEVVATVGTMWGSPEERNLMVMFPDGSSGIASRIDDCALAAATVDLAKAHALARAVITGRSPHLSVGVQMRLLAAAVLALGK